MKIINHFSYRSLLIELLLIFTFLLPASRLYRSIIVHYTINHHSLRSIHFVILHQQIKSQLTSLPLKINYFIHTCQFKTNFELLVEKKCFLLL